MNLHEVLRTRVVEIAAEIETLRNEETQIKMALGILDGETLSEDKKPLKREDAIIEAVKSGQKKPQDIHKYLTRKMGVKMNIGSLRSTLTRLKKDGRINHDDIGWVM